MCFGDRSMSDRIARFCALVMIVATVASVLATSTFAPPLAPSASQHESEGHTTADLGDPSAALQDIVVGDSTSDGESHTLEILVAADEEFIAKAGVGWREAATDVLLAASGLMDQIGIEINVVAVERWNSDNDELEITSLHDAAIEQTGS
jgi:hypothetical protein